MDFALERGLPFVGQELLAACIDEAVTNGHTIVLEVSPVKDLCSFPTLTLTSLSGS